MGVAAGPSGSVWVTDYLADRVDEFTEAGEWIGAVGWGSSAANTAKTATDVHDELQGGDRRLRARAI